MIRIRETRKLDAVTRRRGMVLIPALSLVMTMVLLTLVMAEMTTTTVRRIAARAEETRLAAAAEAAIDLSMHELWVQGVAAAEGEAPSLQLFRGVLDGLGVGVLDPEAEGPGLYDPLSYTEPEWADILGIAKLPADANNDPTIDGTRIETLEMVRADEPLATAMRVHARISFGGDGRHRSRDVERIYLAAGEEFDGFDFALLANNINCILCHANVDSADRYFNNDPGQFGTFDRVRVGSLESLKVRVSSADSQIAGSLYVRGSLMKQYGEPLSDLSSSTLVSADFDPDEGLLLQDDFGDLYHDPFVQATGDPLPMGGNFYLDYPTDAQAQTDGGLPTSFPPVIPDTNEDRMVNPTEFLTAVSGADGTLSGGNKAWVAHGDVYGSTSVPSVDQSGDLSGVIDGNLVLSGTEENPIVIDGRIAVSGDVVLEGVVKGAGEIVTGGNIYVVGAVGYADGYDADGNRIFGEASDGTANRLTLAAGGNVLVGDFLRNSGGGVVTGDPSGSFNFAMDEITLFNQMEWTKASPTLPDEQGNPQQNPLYDPDHQPRYYTMFEGDDIQVYNKGKTWFDPSTGTWMGDDHPGAWNESDISAYAQGSAEVAGATVIPLVPGGWLPSSALLSMWDDAEQSHAGGPMDIDAFLYTSNSIMMANMRSSVYGGQATVNGGVVAADVGVFLPGPADGSTGFQLNYDGRHRGALQLNGDVASIELRRGVRLR